MTATDNFLNEREGKKLRNFCFIGTINFNDFKMNILVEFVTPEYPARPPQIPRVTPTPQ
jgi:hypothetical protein